MPDRTPTITIPTIGTVITLDDDWRFGLFPERRNEKLWQAIVGTDMYGWHEDFLMCELGVFVPVTLPAGTVLIVDRIYLRKGIADYDSVSFRIRECPSDKRLAKKRFWAKLSHVNLIRGTWDEETVPRFDEAVLPPEDVLVPWYRWGFLSTRIPQEIYDELWAQSRLGESHMTRSFEVHVRRGLVQVLEFVDGSPVELFVERPGGVSDVDVE